MPAASARLLVVNDYALVGEGIARFLAPFAEQVTVVGSVATGEPLLGAVDLALYDTFGRTGVDLDDLRALHADPAARAVAVYAFDAADEVVAGALDAGAAGVVSKAMSAGHLVKALLRVVAGEQVVAGPTGVGRSTREERGWPGQDLGLSEREAEVVALAALGHRNSEIADALQVSVDTVKTHLARSFRKLDVHNRTALSALVHTNATFRRTPAAAVA